MPAPKKSSGNAFVTYHHDDEFLYIERKNGDVLVNNLKGKNRGFTLFINKAPENMDVPFDVPFPKPVLLVLHNTLVKHQPNRKQANTVTLLFQRLDEFDEKLYISVEVPDDDPRMRKLTLSFNFKVGEDLTFFDLSPYDEEAEHTLMRCDSKDDTEYYRLHIPFEETVERLAIKMKLYAMAIGKPQSDIDEIDEVINSLLAKK